jgi:ABC-type transporter Mla MlaB component
VKNITVTRPHLVLEAGCTLRDAIELQFLLLTTDCDSGPVIVDGTRVEQVDTAGLQLLVAFAQAQARAGRTLQWTGVSEPLLRGSRRLGTDALLGLDMNSGAQAPQA